MSIIHTVRVALLSSYIHPSMFRMASHAYSFNRRCCFVLRRYTGISCSFDEYHGVGVDHRLLFPLCCFGHRDISHHNIDGYPNVNQSDSPLQNSTLICYCALSLVFDHKGFYTSKIIVELPVLSMSFMSLTGQCADMSFILPGVLGILWLTTGADTATFGSFVFGCAFDGCRFFSSYHTYYCEPILWTSLP